MGCTDAVLPLVRLCPFVAGPLEEGRLTHEAVQRLWASHVGGPTDAADEAAFGRFWAAVHDHLKTGQECPSSQQRR